MLRNQTELQSQYEVVLLEDLMPQAHLLRKIEAILDTDYIRECTREFYSKRGRPAVCGRPWLVDRNDFSTPSLQCVGPR